ncbi:MAG: SDR family oxidoreductase [Pseudomonadaceae bacterium]|nr:SDR family oxidoreductase [Pseudomonadaceae bacterium]
MTKRLTDKTALVTAAGQGIGRATAAAFHANGARVIATDINSDLLAKLQEDFPQIICEKMDVTSNADVSAVAAKHADIDVLFNCAGFVHHGNLLDTDDQALAGSFDINVTSMYRTIRQWLPNMIKKGGGSIVNMSSVASSVAGVPDRFVYGTTKAAVVGLTKSVAADFVKSGVRCNAICPGTVETPSLHERIQRFDDPDIAQQNFIDRQPMGRLGQPAEIAALAVYLASDESSFTTGTIHVIDGGWSN